MTPRQKDCLDFVTKYVRENEGVAPSFEEIMNALGLRSKSGVHRLMTALEQMGLIARVHHRARRVSIPGEWPGPPDTLTLFRDAASKCLKDGHSLQKLRRIMNEEYAEHTTVRASAA